jgi:hypothetical protein
MQIALERSRVPRVHYRKKQSKNKPREDLSYKRLANANYS